ncbi:thiamine-phosphate kinase [Marinospirillum alkaliphilum]|uniref:Thiamine-monophosphate kinase n=1 Tax=Marinospirillum alkaliphilum DSM 21637 TaxID=1122209 RepID=A0A1K1V3W1_9GAMM|nr:thiamine-phosphate kinase [Marinospirillum alkaliphilum]SFX19818.1 thiamine-monophosphate kinase [Marinospirillum alkaliphilum DSM 21637]
MDEFALINRWFTGIGPKLPEVVAGVGDDCALLQLQPGEQLAISVDTSVVDRHFPAQADPWAIGWRALAVALSDLAAMAARPLGFTLAVTLPQVDETWLDAFSQGLRALADQTRCPLIGGDTTRGPLSFSVQVHGAVDAQHVWRRSGARAGDVIALLGPVGLANAGLRSLLEQPERGSSRQQWSLAEQAYMLPRPLIREALRLMQGCRIHAAIDVSDGLLADLQHLLAASALAAELDTESLVLAPELIAQLGEVEALEAALQGGDDYALILALDEQDFDLARNLCPGLQQIGRCVPGAGIRTPQGRVLEPRGYNHFAMTSAGYS